MSTPEKKAKEEVKKALAELGCTEHFAPKGGAFGAIGVADRVACIRGRYVAIECKAGANKLSPMQAHRLHNTHANRGIGLAYWAGNYDTLIDVLSAYIKHDPILGVSCIIHGDYVGLLDDDSALRFIKRNKKDEI